MPENERIEQHPDVPPAAPAAFPPCADCQECFRLLEVWEHAACGFVGFWADYLTAGEPCCPKCGADALGADSLLHIDELFVCVDCDRRFDTPPANATNQAEN